MSLSAIKLRVRNVRRLQLVCLNLFYEHIQARHAPQSVQSSSKPVQPLFYGLSAATQLDLEPAMLNVPVYVCASRLNFKPLATPLTS